MTGGALGATAAFGGGGRAHFTIDEEEWATLTPEQKRDAKRFMSGMGASAGS